MAESIRLVLPSLGKGDHKDSRENISRHLNDFALHLGARFPNLH
jgi:hypothetical protein